MICGKYTWRAGSDGGVPSMSLPLSLLPSSLQQYRIYPFTCINVVEGGITL